jgi:hypothetical protein
MTTEGLWRFSCCLATPGQTVRWNFIPVKLALMPARGATYARAESSCLLRFNPRPRAGGDEESSISKTETASFNPRPRAGGDVGHNTHPHATCGFQSTPPRGGRPKNQLTIRKTALVSIHAPARGATEIILSKVGEEKCFNPRPRSSLGNITS